MHLHVVKVEAKIIIITYYYLLYNDIFLDFIYKLITIGKIKKYNNGFVNVADGVLMLHSLNTVLVSGIRIYYIWQRSPACEIYVVAMETDVQIAFLKFVLIFAKMIIYANSLFIAYN